LATRGFVVIAVSLRGHGQSTWIHPINKARIADYVADVRRVLDDAVGRGIVPSEARMDAVIVGHSLVALAYAERYLLAGVVVVGGPAIHLWIRINSRTLRRFLAWRRWPPLLRSLINPAALFATEPLVRKLLLDHALPNGTDGSGGTDGIGSVVAADPADVAAWRAQLHPTESRAIVTDMRAFAKRGLRPLQPPHLLFLGGRFEVFFPPAIIAQSAASYREIGVDAQEVLVDGAHDLMLDCRESAAEQAADALAAFAARCTTAACM
jgi:pimeloyl-ACP methyl ester carboxylesterase